MNRDQTAGEIFNSEEVKRHYGTRGAPCKGQARGHEAFVDNGRGERLRSRYYTFASGRYLDHAVGKTHVHHTGRSIFCSLRQERWCTVIHGCSWGESLRISWHAPRSREHARALPEGESRLGRVPQRVHRRDFHVLCYNLSLRMLSLSPILEP